MSRRPAAALVFGTSSAVLVLEILAVRLLAPYVGVGLETFSAIIGVVLAGIATGTWLGGRLADRRDPRRMLPPELAFGGVATLATVPVARVLGPAAADGGGPALVLVTIATVFLPSAALSAVPPTVVKLTLRDLSRTGSVVGMLSAVGTAGAIFGTFLTGFLLIGLLPTSVTLIGLGGLLVAAGVLLGPLPRRGTVLAAVALAVLASIAAQPCDVETRYACAVVQADPENRSGRFLVLDTVDNSYVDLEDPRHLRFTYSRMFAAIIQSETAGPLDAVHIGGGGFTMPRWLETVRPGSRSLVLERDGELVELARRRLGLETGPRLRVLTGDARRHLDDLADESADVVLGDAFSGLSVPWHLTTIQVVQEISRILRPDGIYLINIIDHGDLDFLRAEAATVAAVFPARAVVSLPERFDQGGNFVIAGTRHPLEADVVRAAGDALGLELDVLTGDDLERFVADAEPLTDDDAPVDQLLSP